MSTDLEQRNTGESARDTEKRGSSPNSRANLRRGNPGNMGGQPEWFRAKLRSMGSHPRTLGYIEECLTGQHGPQAALAAWGHCLRYGLGEQRSVELMGKLTVADMTQVIGRLTDAQLSRVLAGEPVELILAESANAGLAKLLPGREIVQEPPAG